MKITKIILALILCFATLVAAFGCARVDPEPKSKTYYVYFDTVISLADYSGKTDAEFSALCARVEGELDKYHKLFDIYNEYDGIVNIATVNKMAGERPVEVSRELFDLLSFGASAYRITGGEVNIAMGAVLSLWHDRRTEALEGGSAALPSEQLLAERQEHCNIDDLVLNEENLTVELRDGEMSLDVGAVAKGYAVERIAEMLEESGVESFVINAGGNVRMIGEKPSGNGWVVGVENPVGDGYSFKLTKKDISVVTSGAYQRYYTVDGKNYGHIIDKDTLYPAEHHLSVTVVVDDSGLADALSTALFSMSYEEGLALIRLVGGEAYWITKDGKLLDSNQ
ncbi:MAG: FAD:protein FMN transferase [Clostridia bacterium]|nr:FAD:protein FMN transferase [Clostridia bacterium]